MAEEERLNAMPQSMDTDDWADAGSDNECDVGLEMVSAPRVVSGSQYTIAIDT